MVIYRHQRKHSIKYLLPKSVAEYSLPPKRLPLKSPPLAPPPPPQNQKS